MDICLTCAPSADELAIAKLMWMIFGPGIVLALLALALLPFVGRSR